MTDMRNVITRGSHQGTGAWTIPSVNLQLRRHCQRPGPYYGHGS